jgi:hypothetical protein
MSGLERRELKLFQRRRNEPELRARIDRHASTQRRGLTRRAVRRAVIELAVAAHCDVCDHAGKEAFKFAVSTAVTVSSPPCLCIILKCQHGHVKLEGRDRPRKRARKALCMRYYVCVRYAKGHAMFMVRRVWLRLDDVVQLTVLCTQCRAVHMRRAECGPGARREKQRQCELAKSSRAAVAA